MSDLGKPILSMLVIAASRWAPVARAEGSLNSAVPVPVPVDAGVGAGAGEGVAGAFVVVLVVCVGAAGTAGVLDDAGPGVEGAAFDVVEAGAGAALGLRLISLCPGLSKAMKTVPLISCRR